MTYGRMMAGALAMLVCGALGQTEAGSEAVHFANPERLAQYFDSTPALAVQALERILTQDQAEALELALFPEPTDEAKKAVYTRVADDLKQLGLAADDAVVTEVSARIAALAKEGR